MDILIFSYNVIVIEPLWMSHKSAFFTVTSTFFLRSDQKCRLCKSLNGENHCSYSILRQTLTKWTVHRVSNHIPLIQVQADHLDLIWILVCAYQIDPCRVSVDRSNAEWTMSHRFPWFIEFQSRRLGSHPLNRCLAHVHRLQISIYADPLIEIHLFVL